MPPLAKNAVDTAAVHLIEDWSNSLDAGVSAPDPDLADTTPPVAALSAPAVTIGEFVVSVSFPETVFGLSADDFMVTNGSPGALSGSRTPFELTVNPDAVGEVTVTLISDRVIDPGENANPPSGVISITNDAPPVVSIAAASADESADGIVFNVSLSAASAFDVRVDFATSSDGSARVPEDFTHSEGTLILPVGTTTASVFVPLIEDAIDELTETFTVELTHGFPRGEGFSFADLLAEKG
jgi:hypothetical protein